MQRLHPHIVHRHASIILQKHVVENVARHVGHQRNASHSVHKMPRHDEPVIDQHFVIHAHHCFATRHSDIECISIEHHELRVGVARSRDAHDRKSAQQCVHTCNQVADPDISLVGFHDRVCHKTDVAHQRSAVGRGSRCCGRQRSLKGDSKGGAVGSGDDVLHAAGVCEEVYRVVERAADGLEPKHEDRVGDVGVEEHGLVVGHEGACAGTRVAVVGAVRHDKLVVDECVDFHVCRVKLDVVDEVARLCVELAEEGGVFGGESKGSGGRSAGGRGGGGCDGELHDLALSAEIVEEALVPGESAAAICFGGSGGGGGCEKGGGVIAACVGNANLYGARTLVDVGEFELEEHGGGGGACVERGVEEKIVVAAVEATDGGYVLQPGDGECAGGVVSSSGIGADGNGGERTVDVDVVEIEGCVGVVVGGEYFSGVGVVGGLVDG